MRKPTLCYLSHLSVVAVCGLSLVLSVTLNAQNVLEPVPVKVRTLGVGVSGLRLASPGFGEGKTLFMADGSFNGPIFYLGASPMLLQELDAKSQLTEKTHTVPLLKVKELLLVGVSQPGSEVVRMIVLPDHYGEADRRSVSVLNITSMPLYVKLGESVGEVAPGALLRRSFQLGQNQKRLSVALVGQSDGERIPLVNSRLRMLPGRDVTVLVTGQEMSDEQSFLKEQVQLSTIYHAPILEVQEIETDAEGKSVVTRTVKGGDAEK